MATTSRLSLRSPAADKIEGVPAPRARTVLELVGNTPLLELTRITRGLLQPGVRLFAKIEGFNPGGSIKDRAVKKMIEVGLERGELRTGKTILDSTSGNL
jgi:cysteine synthase B